MKLTLCTFQLEMLSQEGSMVATPLTTAMEMEVIGDAVQTKISF